MAPTHRDALKKLEKLSEHLETAKEAAEVAAKEVEHARHTTRKVKRDVRQSQEHDSRRRGKSASTAGKSKAAVQLGRKGGAARARKLTPQQRSAIARRAAKSRWNTR